MTRVPATADGTDVEVTVEARPQNLGARLLAFALSPLLKACAKEVSRDLADIEAALRAAHAALAAT